MNEYGMIAIIGASPMIQHFTTDEDPVFIFGDALLFAGLMLVLGVLVGWLVRR